MDIKWRWRQRSILRWDTAENFKDSVSLLSIYVSILGFLVFAIVFGSVLFKVSISRVALITLGPLLLIGAWILLRAIKRKRAREAAWREYYAVDEKELDHFLEHALACQERLLAASRDGTLKDAQAPTEIAKPLWKEDRAPD